MSIGCVELFDQACRSACALRCRQQIEIKREQVGCLRVAADAAILGHEGRTKGAPHILRQTRIVCVIAVFAQHRCDLGHQIGNQNPIGGGHHGSV